MSGVDPQGDLKSHSGFCFPVQIAHGAVLDLARHGVNLVFLPHVMRMPQPNACRDSYLCPITQASPYFIAKAFPGIRFFPRCWISPAATRPVRRWWNWRCASWASAASGPSGPGRPPCAPRRKPNAPCASWGSARSRRRWRRASRRCCSPATATTPSPRKPRSRWAEKLASMGVTAIPADCLLPVDRGPTAWHFANQIMNAVALARQHPNLFLLCVSNFSCTIDAFTHSMLASELGAKPYLILEIDAHTADAGVQTRLEAFLDIIHNYRVARASHAPAFHPCRLTKGGRVIRSNGEHVPLDRSAGETLPPQLLPVSHRAFSLLAIRWLGLHAGEPRRSTGPSSTGVSSTPRAANACRCRCASGSCSQIHDRRQPGEIAGFFMRAGRRPCVIDSYLGYFERFIAERQWPDLFLVNVRPENDYLGFDALTLAKQFVAGDPAGGHPGGDRPRAARRGRPRQRRAAPRGVAALRRRSRVARPISREVARFVDRLAALPRTRDPPAALASWSPAISSPASVRSSWTESATSTPRAASSSSPST